MSPSESRSTRILQTLLWVLLSLAGTVARAELRQFGDYDVHYTVFASDFLQPETASALGIVRAKDRAVLNVSVRRRVPGDATGHPVEARPSGTLSDLVHPKELEFTPVHEPGAIYYLAQFPFRDAEQLLFRLRIGLEDRTVEMQFDKTLYVD